MAVYLLHSTVPLTRENGQAVRHYLGYCDDGTLGRRLREHGTRSASARIVQAFLAKGATLLLGNYWQGLTPADERRMKRNGHLSRLCLMCQLTRISIELRALPGRTGVSAPMLHVRSSGRGRTSLPPSGPDAPERMAG